MASNAHRAFTQGSLFSGSQGTNSKRILTAEIGVIRTVVPKMPFACGKRKRETFRWGSAGTCRLSKKLITYSVPIVSHFREDGRTSQCCVLAELCSLGPPEILQGDRRQARTRRLRSL